MLLIVSCSFTCYYQDTDNNIRNLIDVKPSEVNDG